MTDNLTHRLNQILPKITSADFLSGQGIGNEIPFYLFDYPASEELRIREHIEHLHDAIPRKAPDLVFKHINLFEFVIDYIKSRGYYEKWLQQEQTKGVERATKSIKSIANAEKLADHFAATQLADQPALVLVSGVGSAYPIVRTHELLNNLHKHTGLTPLVFFYPGIYDKITLRLFGKASLSHDSASEDGQRQSRYYRAFRLAD